MLRLIAATGIMAITGSALAQDVAPGPKSMSEPQLDSAATPPAPAAIAEPAAEAAPVTAEPSKEMQVKQVVETNFPTYDVDQSGDLNAKEFGSWLTVLREKSSGTNGAADNMPAAKKQAWLNAAFDKADADQSTKISKAELETFLLG
jgi:acyl CoA:acetate/3-ketoacid CoA transferase beta subunit